MSQRSILGVNRAAVGSSYGEPLASRHFAKRVIIEWYTALGRAGQGDMRHAFTLSALPRYAIKRLARLGRQYRGDEIALDFRDISASPLLCAMTSLGA